MAAQLFTTQIMKNGTHQVLAKIGRESHVQSMVMNHNA